MGLFARLRFRAAFWARALLLLPATLLHELSHLIVAILTGCRIHGLSLWPKIEWRDGLPASLEYGHVRYAPRIAVAHLFVGLSPLLLLPLALWLLQSADMHLWPLPPRFDEARADSPATWARLALAFYAVLGSVPSRPDLANALKGVLSPSGILSTAAIAAVWAQSNGWFD